MSVIRTDRRQARYTDHPEVRERAAARVREMLGAKLLLARDLVVLDRDRSFYAEDCSTIGHFGTRHRGDPVDISALCDVGYALEGFPELEAMVLDGRVSLRNAVFLGRLCRHEGAVRPGDRWVELAAANPTHVVRSEVEARLEELKRGASGVVQFSAQVTAPEAERFERARVLASRKAGKHLTRGQALACITDHYLACEDPDLRGKAKRRMGPTGEKPGSRTIAREVLRQLRARSGDRCEYPGCTNKVFVEKAHIKTPKAQGGGQEIDDVGNLCHPHHTMHDAGRFRLVAWTLELRPIYRRREGEILWPPGTLEPPARDDGAGEVRDRSWFVRVGPTSRHRPGGWRPAPRPH